MVYKFIEGFVPAKKLDPQAVGDRLEALSKKTNYGKIEALSPATIVNDAKSRFSPLHNAFEWDNTRAAAKYRIQQARKLVGSIVVVRVIKNRNGCKEKITTRGFVHIQSQSYGSGYISHVCAMEDEECREYVLEEAREEFDRFRQKYQNLSTLARLFKVAEEIFSNSKLLRKTA